MTSDEQIDNRPVEDRGEARAAGGASARSAREPRHRARSIADLDIETIQWLSDDLGESWGGERVLREGFHSTNGWPDLGYVRLYERNDGRLVAVYFWCTSDRPETHIAERESGPDAAIIEFDTLADAIRTTPQYDDAIAAERFRFTLLVIRRVVVRRRCRKFTGTRVDDLVTGVNPQPPSEFSYVLFLEAS